MEERLRKNKTCRAIPQRCTLHVFSALKYFCPEITGRPGSAIIQLIIPALLCKQLLVGTTLDDTSLPRTMIQSLLRTVESLWAITKVVLPSISLSIPSCTSFSVRVSMELVASSRIRTGGSATAARAMERSCLWPWLKFAPFPRRRVL